MTRVINCERPPSADDRRTAWGVFPHLPMEPISRSEDANWRFLGLEMREYPCDDIEQCRPCWPCCAWRGGDLDGTCENDERPVNNASCALAPDRMDAPPWFAGA